MQSILELFKLEVDYSSTSFWQKCKIAQELLIQQCNQHWNYLRQKSIIHQFPFSKSARLHRSHLYSNSINTGTIEARSQIIHQLCFSKSARIAQESLIQQLSQHWDYLSQKFSYSSTLFQQKCKVAQESLIQQLNQYWDYLSQKSIIHQLCFSKSTGLHRSHLYSNSINTGTI